MTRTPQQSAEFQLSRLDTQPFENATWESLAFNIAPGRLANSASGVGLAAALLRGRYPESASVVRASDPEQGLPQGGIESAVQDVTPRRGVIVDPPASYLVAKDGPERSAIAADAEPEFVESESVRRLRFLRAARRGILGAPRAFALPRSRDLSFPPVRVASAPTRVVRLSHCPILTVPRDRQTDGQLRASASQWFRGQLCLPASDAAVKRSQAAADADKQEEPRQSKQRENERARVRGCVGRKAIVLERA